MRLHAIQTGTVAIKQRQVRGSGQGFGRRLNTMLDRVWTDPLPIYVWVIEHPEGIIVVDTGETARTTEPGYFPWWHPYYRLGVQAFVRPEEEIGPQIQTLGFSLAEVCAAEEISGSSMARDTAREGTREDTRSRIFPPGTIRRKLASLAGAMA